MPDETTFELASVQFNDDQSITTPVDTFDRIDVRPWPVHQLIASLRAPDSSEIARSAPVDAAGEYVRQEVTISVPSAQMPSFLSAAADADPWLQPKIQRTYTWQDVRRCSALRS